MGKILKTAKVTLVGLVLAAGCASSSAEENILSNAEEDILIELKKRIENHQQKIIEQKIKDLERKAYNETYIDNEFHDIISQINDLEAHVKNPDNIISFRKMCDVLKREKIILFGDMHPNIAHRDKQMEILKDIKNENLVVGMECFRLDQQKELNKYMKGEMPYGKFLIDIGYRNKIMRSILEGFAYIDLLNFLKNNSIETIALGSKIGSPMLDLLRKIGSLEKEIEKYMAEKSPSPEKRKLYEEKIKEWKRVISQCSKITINTDNIYEKDSQIVKIVDEYVKKDKQVVVIIGSLHTETNHLNYLIQEKIKIDPAIVLQNQNNINIRKIFYGYETLYKTIEDFGLTEGKILRIGKNDFYINTPIDIDGLKEAIFLEYLRIK